MGSGDGLRAGTRLGFQEVPEFGPFRGSLPRAMPGGGSGQPPCGFRDVEWKSRKHGGRSRKPGGTSGFSGAGHCADAHGTRDRGRSEGMRSIKVFTGLDVNHEAARRLYEGLGFRDVWQTVTYGMALDSD